MTVYVIIFLCVEPLGPSAAARRLESGATRLHEMRLLWKLLESERNLVHTREYARAHDKQDEMMIISVSRYKA